MNRKILDDKINNKQIFIDFFKRLGDYLEGKDIKICLENNSKDYKCNFMNTIKECSDIIREINKNNIKMMVDLGNAVMENDEWYYLRNHMDIICNIDISNPYMKDFSNIHESNEIFNHVLKVNEYNGIINLEMLIDSQKDEIEILMKSLNNFVRLYGL
jgi:sugar phosphate isomerase/epimerase